MSEENVEIVRGWFDRWNRGDRFFGEEIHAEVEIFSRFQPTPYRGAEGFQRWREEIDEQFQKWRLAADDWRDAGGGRVVVLGHVHMQGRGSGVEFNQSAGVVVDVEEGKLRRMRLFGDQAAALEAAGLRSRSGEFR